MRNATHEPPSQPSNASANRWLGVGELLWLPMPESVLPGLFRLGEVLLLYGATATGKTTIAFDMLEHAACGKSWLRGSKPTRGLKVAYICTEGGRAAAGNRIAAWLDTTFADDSRRYAEQRLKENFSILDHEVPLTDVKALEELRAAYYEQYHCLPDVVVVDTYSMCIGEGVENENETASLILRNLRTVFANPSREGELRGQSAVVVIHHASNDGCRDPRGATGLLAGVDHALRLEGRAEELVKVSTRKARGMVFETLHVRIGVHALQRDGKPWLDEAGVQITAPFVIPVVKSPSANKSRKLDVHDIGEAMRQMLLAVHDQEEAPSKKRFLALLATQGAEYGLRRSHWDKHGDEVVALGYVRIEVQGVAHRVFPGPGPKAYADPPGTQDGRASGSATSDAEKGDRP